MLPLQTRANVTGVSGKAILKVLTLEEAKQGEIDASKCLIWRQEDRHDHVALGGCAWAGFVEQKRSDAPSRDGQIVVDEITTPGVIAPGDVIRVVEGSSRVSVLYRRGSNSNTLLATERCNSFCLMCSQPPREVDDEWYVDEILATIPLIDLNERQVGISGGEPTLLGDDLLLAIHQARRFLPSTELHILSNGRRFSDEGFARRVCAVGHPNLQWGIPVYSDSAETHDFIVQSKGAWRETLKGLYNLAQHRASVEIRVVVQQANVARLGELAYFIFRNLAFVDHVAFMALEPIGFARHNRDKLWVDPADCAESLGDAAFFLSNRGMTVSLYNFPLCTLPRELWPFCSRSISDWKNTYLPECDNCDVRVQCGGFFATIDEGWTSRLVSPIKTECGAPAQRRLEPVL